MICSSKCINYLPFLFTDLKKFKLSMKFLALFISFYSNGINRPSQYKSDKYTIYHFQEQDSFYLFLILNNIKHANQESY